MIPHRGIIIISSIIIIIIKIVNRDQGRKRIIRNQIIMHLPIFHLTITITMEIEGRLKDIPIIKQIIINRPLHHHLIQWITQWVIKWDKILHLNNMRQIMVACTIILLASSSSSHIVKILKLNMQNLIINHHQHWLSRYHINNSSNNNNTSNNSRIILIVTCIAAMYMRPFGTKFIKVAFD